MSRKVAIIGSGFSGLSAASYLSKDGYEVHVFEKNSEVGGRARQFTTDNGYVFDMGPSWYWMPDIIEAFFNDFGRKSTDFYDLIPLNPQFEMVFSDGVMGIPENYEEMKNLFESIEKGAGKQLDEFMNDAQYKYEVGMKDFVNKPCHSWFEFVSPKIAKSALKLDLLTNFQRFVRKYFKNPKLIMLMEFPVIFLGAAPKDIPALYSLMNYGGYKLGTWYPMGGFAKVTQAMMQIASEGGVHFHFDSNVEKIILENNKAVGLKINGEELRFDTVIASSDYQHTETLLPESHRNYDEKYWEKRVFAPSCLIYYLGFSEKIPNLTHHTLFFENDLELHTNEIYEDKKWPTKPLFYACCPSKTDKDTAPENGENVFLLMPVAPGIEDSEDMREKYFLEMISRLEKHTGTSDLISKLEYKRSYCVEDFKKDYNAYKGNAYGLANTLSQTAVLKPSVKNRKVKNLLYTGQLTVPGPGVPPSIISGKIVAREANKLN
ncbi:phytoene desaturase family protein [Chryseobacterium gambrini]|uniref:Phytoene desaturase family protein n=1 Tax=Chryseobacterium gambrini TaxID=373672 RepID=A0AAJ1R7F6_9FLAO|nr:MULTISPECIES: phytoene desaturase family protein [Chryseobacterium]MDN4013674.1 phytoene desaturase family protein [Chryseobacterium gambrini]MDN4028039.1 phytoene desaturase family protein [Chryseobacterium gambrini]QWA39756.1 phytoene desaturase [Chryseobacterium sp. ZHDP1]